MIRLFDFKESKQKYVFIFLLIITFLDIIIYKENHSWTQLIVFGFWLWFFLKHKIEDIFIIKTAVVFLLASLFFYIILQTEFSGYFLNAGIVFILLAVIIGFIKHVKDEIK